MADCLGHGLIIAQPNTGGGELDHGEVVRGALFVARGDAPKMFDFVEKALDEVALFVEFGIEGRRRAPRVHQHAANSKKTVEIVVWAAAEAD